ncbi:MAG: hypothetical protein QY328_01065 [Anaerolineales bacterium]|nr:MAG: hypothetical protein QY328_01065 [Anaerolineales bacterium]
MTMAYKHATARYRQWYAKLLCFYPKPYREHFEEGMQQTFNDLCRERHESGNNLLGFVLWTFADTLTGIIKENIEKENKIMLSTLKNHGAVIIYIITAIAIIVTALLLKNTEYENAWFYIFAVGSVLASLVEVYSKTKDKGKG